MPAHYTVSYSTCDPVTSPKACASGYDSALKLQVAQLNVSRDKLLAELEKQFLEVDQLAAENAALIQLCSTCLTSG